MKRKGINKGVALSICECLSQDGLFPLLSFLRLESFGIDFTFQYIDLGVGDSIHS